MINGEDPFRAEYDVNDGTPLPAQPTAVAAARIVAVTRTLAAGRREQTLTARVAELQALMAGVLDELAVLKAIPETDPVEPGGLLVWTYRYRSGGAVYQCAALRTAGGAYFTTGTRTPQRVTWEELAAWLASHQVRDLRRVTATEPVSGTTVDAEVTQASTE